MSQITWKYVKSLKNPNIITEVEQEFGIVIPQDLKEIIEKFNNGRPSLNEFDTTLSKGNEFKKLLSFNAEDIENVFDFKNIETNIQGLFPFASNSSGNLICLYEGKIVYWIHETDSLENISDTFTEFLNSLY